MSRKPNWRGGMAVAGLALVAFAVVNVLGIEYSLTLRFYTMALVMFVYGLGLLLAAILGGRGRDV